MAQTLDADRDVLPPRAKMWDTERNSLPGQHSPPPSFFNAAQVDNHAAFCLIHMGGFARLGVRSLSVSESAYALSPAMSSLLVGVRVINDMSGMNRDVMCH